MKGFKGMKIKTIKSLLIAITATAILTGCNSKNTTIETEATTEIENLTETTTESESETETTTEETSTIEETSTETETTEVETSTIEEMTTEQETKDVIYKDSMTFASDVSEADIEQIMKAVDVGLVNMTDSDGNGDGVIDKDEAEILASVYDDELLQEYADLDSLLLGDDAVKSAANTYKNSNSATNSSSTESSSTSASTSTIIPRDENPNGRTVEPGSGDTTGFSTTSHSY
jgi:hypothetical protein